MSTSSSRLPYPPLELRGVVGPLEDSAYDNPNGDFIWGQLAYPPLEAGEAYRRIFDFGCGCGRDARRLLLQRTPPEEYVGVDVNLALLSWCQDNLSRPNVRFYHHDVWSRTYAPGNSPNRTLPIRHYGSDFSLINAHSVFTHLYEDQALFYLQEMRHMISEKGIIRSTWFFFNRDWFPPLAPSQNCLYLQIEDPTQAIYYDWSFFVSLVRRLDLRIVDRLWADVPGHQNVVILAKGNMFEDRADHLVPSDNVLGFGASAPRKK